MERTQYESLDPMSETAILDALAAHQGKLDEEDAQLEDLKAQKKETEARREKVIAKMAVFLQARRESKPVFRLVGGEVTGEKPDDASLFDGVPAGATGERVVETPKGAAEAAGEVKQVGPGEGAPAVPADVIEALDLYRSGRCPVALRKVSAEVLLKHIGAGGQLPQGYDAKEIRSAAKKVLKEKDDPAAAAPATAAAATESPASPAETPAAVPFPGSALEDVKVTTECVPSVNVIPVTHTSPFKGVGFALVPESGEIMRINEIRSRRNELVVDRGVGGKVKTIPVGGVLRPARDGSEVPVGAPATDEVGL